VKGALKRMAHRRVAPTVVDAIELPRILRLEENFYAASFVLMKLLPARFIMDRARDAGLVGKGSTVIESTSGTFGLALAIVCALSKYNLVLVSDPVIDPALKRRLEDLGARVEIVVEPAPVGGFQRARLDRMAQIQAESPNHFWPSQYDNPHNPGSYSLVAELLLESVGTIDCLVGAVGSGGSVCGSGSYLRLVNPDLKVVGVDTHGSVLFGQPERKRLLRGLGNSILPRNLDHSAFDEVHWVNAAEAFIATRQLHSCYALFHGPTSGAAYMVALWWLRQNPGARVVVIFPDEGYRYQDTVYNDEWLQHNNLLLTQLPSGPELVNHPAEAGLNWSRIHWNRRSLDSITGGSFKPGELCIEGQ
jgi:S-sulfo-L-cysteine synthase (3-phospho-L-serine-dependent)